MLRLFAHPVAYCCNILLYPHSSLGLLASLYKQVVRLTQKGLLYAVFMQTFLGPCTLITYGYHGDSDPLMCRSTRNFNIPPPPPPQAVELLKIGSFKFLPLRAKMVFIALPYRQICLSYPTKEQSSSAPAVFNKDLLKTFFCKQISHKCYISSFKLFHLVQTRVL